MMEDPDDSNVFGDVGSLTLSSCNGDSWSIFSFLLGFASHGKANVVVASNVSKKPLLMVAATLATGTAIAALSPNVCSDVPHCHVLSLFAFSEEDSKDLCLSSNEKQQQTDAAAACTLKMAPSNEKTSSSIKQMTVLGWQINAQSAAGCEH